MNLSRKLCFRGLKMVSAGPLFLGWAGHTRKNRGGCAGLTVSELGLSLLLFSGRNVASKLSWAGRWDANQRHPKALRRAGFLEFLLAHWPIPNFECLITLQFCFVLSRGRKLGANFFEPFSASAITLAPWRCQAPLQKNCSQDLTKHSSRWS